MASYVPVVKNDSGGAIFYVSLVSQSNTKVFQANPTLASGDAKIAIDDGAPANLGTLPQVDADFTKRVKITLSQAETNGDNLTIILSDAAGDEWCDLTMNIQTVARQIDDLAFPNTSGRGIDVETGGEVGINFGNVAGTLAGGEIAVGAFASGAITADAIAANAIGASEFAQAAADLVWSSGTRELTGNTNLNDPTAAAIADAVWDEDQADHIGAGSFGLIASEIADILVDTAEIGTAGDGLTNINLPDQAMNITGDITGSLSGSIGSLAAQAKADVNAEVADVINTDPGSLPGKEAPSATAPLRTMVEYLYKAWRNKSTQTATTYSLYDDAGAIVDQEATVEDNGTTATKGEVGIGT